MSQRAVMRLGPFDQRKRRSRCLACSRSHIKCSGSQPCATCARKGIACEFPAEGAAQAATTSDVWVHRTAADYTRRQLQQQPKNDTDLFLHFFDDFAERNSLTGQRGHSLTDDINILEDVHSQPHLLDAMLAVGALQAGKRKPIGDPGKTRYAYDGMVHYTKAIEGLRISLETMPQSPNSQKRISVLWTTLLLGLFELLNEKQTSGYIKHMTQGTIRALQAIGTSVCETDAGRRFFRQARIMEISRAISFDAPSFLAEPMWRKMIESQRGESREPLDLLLDTMAMCGALRARAKRVIAEVNSQKLQSCMPFDEAREVVAEGFRLRAAFEAWNSQYGQPVITEYDENDEARLLSQIWYRGMSVYLSGCFDFEMANWRRLKLTTPNLSVDVIAQYMDDIFRLTEIVLSKSKLSPLLILYPVAVTGMRSTDPALRQMTLQFIERAERQYAAAGLVQTSVSRTWDLVDSLMRAGKRLSQSGRTHWLQSEGMTPDEDVEERSRASSSRASDRD